MRCGSHLITSGLFNEVWLTHLITTLTSSIHLITGGLLNEVWLTLNNQWFIQ